MIKVRFNNVSKTYKCGEEKVKELSNFNLEIKNGEIVVLCGSYGTFKTTLLNFLVKKEKVSDGEIIVDDVNIEKIKTKDLIKKIGYVLNSGNLIEDLTLIENIMLSKKIAKSSIDENEIISKLCLDGKEKYYPCMLSSEEKILASIVISIVKDPEIILLDESLDNIGIDKKKKVIKLLKSLSKSKKSIIITTKNESLDNTLKNVFLLKEKDNIVTVLCPIIKNKRTKKNAK